MLTNSSSRPVSYKWLRNENLLRGSRWVTRSLRNDTWLVAQGINMPGCHSIVWFRSISSAFSASSGANSSSATASPRFDGPAPIASSSTSTSDLDICSSI